MSDQLTFPADPSSQTPENEFSPESTPLASSNGVKYKWEYDGIYGVWRAEGGPVNAPSADIATPVIIYPPDDAGIGGAKDFYPKSSDVVGVVPGGTSVIKTAVTSGDETTMTVDDIGDIIVGDNVEMNDSFELVTSNVSAFNYAAATFNRGKGRVASAQAWQIRYKRQSNKMVYTERISSGYSGGYLYTSEDGVTWDLLKPPMSPRVYTVGDLKPDGSWFQIGKGGCWLVDVDGNATEPSYTRLFPGVTNYNFPKGCFYSELFDRWYVAIDDHVYVSDDGNISESTPFTKVRSKSSTEVHISDRFFDYTTPDGTDFIVAVNNCCGDIIISTNGTSFTTVLTYDQAKSISGTSSGAYDIDYNPNTGVLIAGATYGVFRSTDLGSSWSYIQTGDIDTVSVKTIHYNPVFNTWMANDQRGPDKVVLSTDDGLSWKFISTNWSSILWSRVWSTWCHWC